MAAKAVKSEAVPQEQDLLSQGDAPKAADMPAAEATEPVAPAEDPAAEKANSEPGEPSPPADESAAPADTPEATTPAAATGAVRKQLKRDEPYGEIIGASSGACYVQDEIYFDAEGNELL